MPSRNVLGWVNQNRIQKGAHFPELLFTRYKLYWDFFKQQLRNTASASLTSRKLHMKTTMGNTSPFRMDINKKTTDSKTGREQGENDGPKDVGRNGNWQQAL